MIFGFTGDFLDVSKIHTTQMSSSIKKKPNKKTVPLRTVPSDCFTAFHNFTRPKIAYRTFTHYFLGRSFKRSYNFFPVLSIRTPTAKNQRKRTGPKSTRPAFAGGTGAVIILTINKPPPATIPVRPNALPK